MFDNNLIKINSIVSSEVKINNYYKFNNKFNILSVYFNSLIITNNCNLSNQLRDKCKISCDFKFESDLNNFITTRWKDLDYVFNWFVKKGYKRGIIKYGWFL